MFTLACALSGSSGGAPPVTPQFTGATNVENQGIGCGVDWLLDVGWTLDIIDDVNFHIDIRDIGNNLIATGLLLSSSPYLANTGDVGDPLATGTFHNAQFNIELVRVSDSTIVDTITTPLLTVETGPAC
jgi:hypothetical protein